MIWTCPGINHDTTDKKSWSNGAWIKLKNNTKINQIYEKTRCQNMQGNSVMYVIPHTDPFPSLICNVRQNTQNTFQHSFTFRKRPPQLVRYCTQQTTSYMRVKKKCIHSVLCDRIVFALRALLFICIIVVRQIFRFLDAQSHG